MAVAVITGSAGLIGAEAARFFADKGLGIVGIDNDMRREFFGEEASTIWSRQRLEAELTGYRHCDIDIRDQSAVLDLFGQYSTSIAAVIHTAAQPSHDWAAKAPFVDFSINGTGTLNLLEATRQYCPDACFIFTSTNKVYGDTPNRLPLVEQSTRWELLGDHPYGCYGIDESMSIDQTMHSLFGASKVAADVLVQEYGRYFGMKTGCFRGGCLTGPGHSGAQLHGFLAYLVKCAVTDTPYVVFGYAGKQVRDNIHSFDLVNAFWHFFEAPRSGEVYNIGGGRYCNCSMLEAIGKCQSLTGRKMRWSYSDANRAGDHIWWISVDGFSFTATVTPVGSMAVEFDLDERDGEPVYRATVTHMGIRALASRGFETNLVLPRTINIGLARLLPLDAPWIVITKTSTAPASRYSHHLF